MVNQMKSPKTSATITSVESAAAARRLMQLLAPARARVATQPSAEVVERMRARVIGAAAPKREHILAA